MYNSTPLILFAAPYRACYSGEVSRTFSTQRLNPPLTRTDAWRRGIAETPSWIIWRDGQKARHGREVPSTAASGSQSHTRGDLRRCFHSSLPSVFLFPLPRQTPRETGLFSLSIKIWKTVRNRERDVTLERYRREIPDTSVNLDVPRPPLTARVCVRARPECQPAAREKHSCVVLTQIQEVCCENKAFPQCFTLSLVVFLSLAGFSCPPQTRLVGEGWRFSLCCCWFYIRLSV